MAEATGKGGKDRQQGEANETKVRFEDDLDALFKLPPAGFTAARNDLAARLKRAGRGDEALSVKALGKPSLSAWAVNQLYWRHRDAFDQLISAAERFRRAQGSQFAGKAADTRAPLAERREALSRLSRLAGALLQDSGHPAAPETMRRVTTTLEALSSLSSDAARPGRLTDDVDPPGFESLAGLIPDAGRAERPERSSARVIPFPPAAGAPSHALSKAPGGDARRREEERQKRIASAKAALHAAELTLRQSRSRAQDAGAALKTATAHADETEKDRREAEKRFAKASTAAEEMRGRLQLAAAEAEKARMVLEDAERLVEKARKEVLHASTKD